MSRLVIVGAGGFGREIHGWVRSSPRWLDDAGINEIVFVDDNIPKIPVNAAVVSKLETYFPKTDDSVICAVGSPEVRRKIVQVLRGRGAHFATFVHDRVILGDQVELNAGVVICPNALLSSNIRVGEHVHINVASSIGHDVSIGDFTTLSAACNLTGGVVVGSGAFLATATTIIPGLKIGDGAYVGAGCIVLKDVPAHTTVFGNPGRTVGKRSV